MHAQNAKMLEFEKLQHERMELVRAESMESALFVWARKQRAVSLRIICTEQELETSIHALGIPSMRS